MKQDLKVEFQQVRGEFQEESETVSVKHSEIEAPTKPKVNSAKQRRIRKVHLMKFLGIKISKIRKRQEKETRLGRVRNFSDCHITKCKRNTLTTRRIVKPKSELTKSNKVKSNPVFLTNPIKVETNRFQAKHHKVKSKKGSLFGKTQNTCVELTRRLGEHLCLKCHKCNENYSFQSDKFSEKLKNCQIVNRKSRHKMSVEEPCKECRKGQILPYSFQKGINLTKESLKMKNWPKSGNVKASNTKVPFKMKKNVVIIKSRKTNVKMKVIYKQVKFGKQKWKI
jgi:hypothetical protein